MSQSATITGVEIDPGHSPYLLVYGTLRVGMPKHGGAVLPELVAVTTGLRVPGRIYDVGEYPAVVLDRAAIRGEVPVTDSFVADVVRVDPSHDHEDAMAELDAYEQGAADEEQVEYRRALVPTGVDGIGDAWVYEWVGPTDRLTLVTDGEWRP
jgi:gamma-glutamylcyclotransferase (GGCT)/AIG2-like uncharacterized protein YtfP